MREPWLIVFQKILEKLFARNWDIQLKRAVHIQPWLRDSNKLRAYLVNILNCLNFSHKNHLNNRRGTRENTHTASRKKTNFSIMHQVNFFQCTSWLHSFIAVSPRSPARDLIYEHSWAIKTRIALEGRLMPYPCSG